MPPALGLRRRPELRGLLAAGQPALLDLAEGVPEQQTREIIKVAESKGVGIIGPATVGGIKPGCLRIGNTGGMLDNIVMSRLYRAGSVAYISKSGRMSNELTTSSLGTPTASTRAWPSAVIVAQAAVSSTTTSATRTLRARRTCYSWVRSVAPTSTSSSKP